MTFFRRTSPLRRGLLLIGGLALAVGALLGPGGDAMAASSEAVSDGESISIAVRALSDVAILRGRDASLLVPRHYVTRAELIVCLDRALRLKESTTSVPADVEGFASSARVIAAVHKAGLADGTISAFSADELVSREEALSWIVSCLDSRIARAQAAAALLESIGLAPEVDSEYVASLRLSSLRAVEAWLGGFQDRQLIDPAHTRAVAAGYRLGVIDASADGCFYPKVSLSWGDMAVMLYRAFLKPLGVRAEYPATLPAQESYPTLTEGSEGPLVWYVEYRLTALKYRPGSVDGVFDYRTSDAVLAFQKVERLRRTGIAEGSFWERIFTATIPTPKRTDIGTRVEVDISRQVLFMITDDQVWKIVHVSTGKGGGTPTGRGTVGVKQTGWNPTRVGSMYYVSYIMPHIAIHGMPSVPIYPASHGCIRVPMWMAVELFYELPKGTRVDLYYNL
jgi:hypothetical protein